jgi:hypothetical protein
LTKAEKNNAAHKLEFVALKWAVYDKFKDYLLGNKTTVLTDNNPLTFVLTTAKLDSTGHRWLAALANFDLNIQYRAGKRNADADGLQYSRRGFRIFHPATNLRQIQQQYILFAKAGQSSEIC